MRVAIGLLSAAGGRKELMRVAIGMLSAAGGEEGADEGRNRHALSRRGGGGS